MRFSKFIAVLTMVALLLSVISVSASEDLSIVISVQDGATLEYGFREIEIGAEEGADVTVILDGDRVLDFVSSGYDVMALPHVPEVGIHELCVISKYGSKISSQELGFEVKYSGYKTAANNIFANESTLRSRPVKPAETGSNAGTDIDGKSLKMTRRYFEGIDGTPDGAVGFSTGAPVADASGAADFYIELYWSGNKLSGEIGVEYDIRINGNMMFEFETSGSGWGNIGTNDMIKNGSFAGLFNYTSGQWYHVKHVVNTNTQKQDLYVDGEKLISGSKFENCSGINCVKVQVRAQVSEETPEVAIDNFVMGAPYEALGTQSVSYKDGEDFAVIEDGLLTESADLLRMTVPTANGTSANVTVYADGEKFADVRASVESGGVIDILLPETLPPQADIKLVADFSEYAVFALFRTFAKDFGVSAFGFETEGKICHTAKELLPGAVLHGSLTVTNNAASDKEAIILLAIYNGNRLEKLVAKAVVSAMQSEEEIEIAVDVPGVDGEYTAECYMLDSFVSRNLLSPIYGLN